MQLVVSALVGWTHVNIIIIIMIMITIMIRIKIMIMQLVVSALVGWTHVNAQGQRCETKADCTGKKTLGC